MDTYYTLLGVGRNATAAQIKTAWRQRILEVHPDTLPNASSYWKMQAKERTQEINEAYAVLSDTAKRRDYDHQLDQYFNQQTPPSTSTARTTSAPPQQPSRPQPRTSTSPAAPTPFVWWKDKAVLFFSGFMLLV